MTSDCTSWYSFRADRFLGLESNSLGSGGQNDVQLRVLRLPGEEEDRFCAVRSVPDPSRFRTCSSRPRLFSLRGVLPFRAAPCLCSRVRPFYLGDTCSLSSYTL